ncbi:MAG: hypothetical protein U9R55_12750, partial [Pseudomonadota bacterium]|nr:hypothetical protein [Pseudomonadota bacterium]
KDGDEDRERNQGPLVGKGHDVFQDQRSFYLARSTIQARKTRPKRENPTVAGRVLEIGGAGGI